MAQDNAKAKTSEGNDGISGGIQKKLSEIVTEEIEYQADRGWGVRLMFQDEGRFGRICDPHRCWAPYGVRPDVPQQVVREYTHAFAAISPHDGTLDSLILPEVTAATMSLFLEEVSIRHPDEFIMMFMDQAGWHRAKDLNIPENMRLYWLPAYSPQCNPVEHLWEEIREKWFNNKVFNSLDAVEDTLVIALSTLEKNKKKIMELTGFEWIVSISMNAN